jgi:PPOX class probable F420-dependent enzyme
MTASLSETARKIIDEPNPAVLATVNPDGSPQTSVVWVRRDGDDLLISSAAGRRKDKNLARDPRVSLTVYDQADPLQYVEVRGLASISEDPGRELAVSLAEEYEGPGAGQEYLELPPEVIRIVIRITPQRVLGSAAQLADGPAPAAELRHDLIAAPDGDVVDAAAAVADALRCGRDQHITFSRRGHEGDVRPGGHRNWPAAVTGAGERGIGEHEHIAAVRDRMPVHHGRADGHPDRRSAVTSLEEFHAEVPGGEVGLEHDRCRAVGRR